jgi:hypothetical protein
MIEKCKFCNLGYTQRKILNKEFIPENLRGLSVCSACYYFDEKGNPECFGDKFSRLNKCLLKSTT